MENATGSGKKTIQPQDVLVALRDTEFDFMIPRIEAELKSMFDPDFILLILSIFQHISNVHHALAISSIRCASILDQANRFILHS